MAGITLAQAETMLAAATEAYTTALNQKSYTIGSRGQQRHDIDKLRAEVDRWDAKVKELSRGTTGMRIRGATPT